MTRLRLILAVFGLAFALVAGSALLPQQAPVPSALKAQPAAAPVTDCVNVARSTYQVTRGNLWAALDAYRNTAGCGGTTASAICYASNQWWGGWARWVVSTITSGQYTRC